MGDLRIELQAPVLFSKGNLIFVTHIAPLEAVILFKMLLLCMLGIAHADNMCNLNN